MDRPNECKFCGCGVRNTNAQTIVYQCWSNQLGDGWEQSVECKLGVAEDRIQRAIDELKSATRYTVENGHAKTLWWDTNPDGYVTDSKAVDEAIAILEGERD